MGIIAVVGDLVIKG
jgi:hypothetical protein